MRTMDALRRSAVSIAPDRSLRDAAAVMEQSNVGALAVVDDGRLVGIVTDRDLVRRAMATGMAPDARVDAVMSMPVVTIAHDADLRDAFALFRTNAVRRLAVMEGDEFVGMVTVDDLIIDLAADLGDLARPVTAETIFGHHDSPVPAVS